MSTFKDLLVKDTTDAETGLSEIELHFLDVLFDKCGGDIPMAIIESGMPRNTSEIQVTRKLRKYITARAKDYLAGQTAKASIALMKIVVDPNLPGSKTAISAIKEVLDRGGAVKDEQLQIDAENVIVILPPKEYEAIDDYSEGKIIDV